MLLKGADLTIVLNQVLALIGLGVASGAVALIGLRGRLD